MRGKKRGEEFMTQNMSSVKRSVEGRRLTKMAVSPEMGGGKKSRAAAKNYFGGLNGAVHVF